MISDEGALSYLKNILQMEGISREGQEAIALAINAIKRDIPAKPRLKYVCPTCGRDLKNSENIEGKSFCIYCNQKIWWE